MNDTLIVIPTYNEIDNIRLIAQAVHRSAPWADILFVDDSSPDGTGDVADEMGQQDSRIHVLHREAKQGLGRAYLAGFSWALERGYEFIFEMDADFSHDPGAIPSFREAAKQADLCLGTRYKGGIRVINWPLSRLALSKGAAAYVQLVTGMPFTDPTGGYKCFRRSVLEALNLDAVSSNGYSFQIELTHKAWMMGFEIVEVPITFEERRSGASKMSAAIVREALRVVWKLYIGCGCRRRPVAGRHPDSIVNQPEQA
ncbi:MAG: polyprenol monophosphomannose synthase [Verrucomicrobia bacterium]|nr:polyprenol monophosphomannose synthase [Kiritimatiellia bacterium]MCP5488176.1 polyprenol monophosphomannose synthase [Verrucomicrobiota bacterium]